MTSAYPTPLDVLADQVRDLAADLGEWPSRNRVIKTFKVGAPKASAVLDTVKASGFDPANPVVDDGPEDANEIAAPTETDAVNPGPEITSEVIEESGAGTSSTKVSAPADPEPTPDAPTRSERSEVGWRAHSWALLLIAAGAFVAIWGGWVGLGKLTGFGEIALLPGIADEFTIDSAITLPLGVEAYAAFALRVWLSASRSDRARKFARNSAIGALVLGACGQVAYHLMTAAGMTSAPWQITTPVSCLPVVVLGCAAALTHLMRDEEGR
ncbi:ABC transporter permease [Actinokineospora auranticolor]|uniref:Uncharacterized protein n=1 Tax=Actinokineospora auranticolor TaxID=155976 RepID=A0A2S6GL14_9PSEU|nr:ABC transporter permease [Actinokineospora auranticolor]PPK65836.1 hypothetical protein CLV40_11298 [Actinokineospora auranticolor]